MKNLITGLLLLLLSWQTGELAWRHLVEGQRPPEAPLWACILLVIVNLMVLLAGIRAIFFSPRSTVCRQD